MVSCPSKKYFGFIGVSVHGMPSLAFTCQAVVAVLTIVQLTLGNLSWGAIDGSQS